MRKIARFVFIGVLFSLFSSPVFALTTYQGKEAAEYLGDIKQHLLAGGYTCEILARSHRDSMHGRFSDGLIFNPGGGVFEYPKRKDGEHIIVLDSPGGREEDPLTEDLWRQKIDNVLSDDNNIPYVFLDDNKKELAVVFVGNDTQVSAKMREDQTIEISISVRGGKENRGRRRMMT